MRGGVLLAVLLVTTGCSMPSQAAHPSASPAASSAPARQVLPGGCGQMPIYRGAIPEWAGVDAPKDLPYVIASPDIAVGYLFSADSGPGEIYPTGPAVPTAGCWPFTLT